MEKIKEQLGYQAYEKLRTLIKDKTSFNNLNAENIADTRRAITLLITWLESIYNIDKVVNTDEDGLDINDLFKVTQ